MHYYFTILIIAFVLSCQTTKETENFVITSDIDLFWEAYDRIAEVSDTLVQARLLDSLYIERGSIGLQKIIEVKRYTNQDYITLINNHPKYWESIRENTYQAKQLSVELKAGVETLRSIYPGLKPAKIYFTIGAMRSNGTTQDSLVLIGSELALGDSLTNISEFEGRTKEWLDNYFGGNPKDGLVLLNVHEYVHTQQHPIPNRILYQSLYEGVAEFVSVTAMGVSSNAPAIEYGKGNPNVKSKFEEEMFYDKTYDWLWSNSTNEFGVRDLGYYIGYGIAEAHYTAAADKLKAVKELIEIDYTNIDAVDALIDNTQFFSKKIDILRTESKARRPKVSSITQFENRSQAVDPSIKEITIHFSEPLNGYNTGIDYGDLGKEGFPNVLSNHWSEDAKSWTMKVELTPNTDYEVLISNNFRTQNGIPLYPYLITFSTSKK